MHHDPDKFTGTRCAGIRKKSHKGRCNVWSGSLYADAAPLREGSLYCAHHQRQALACTAHDTDPVEEAELRDLECPECDE